MNANETFVALAAIIAIGVVACELIDLFRHRG
jgi:hypothetical protein